MTTTVCLSGPAFSFLLYETNKGCLKQEGFLLGEVVLEETRTITDNDQQQVNVSKVIKVNSAVPCPPGVSYFSNGKINENKISNFLGNDFSKVVAWYKFSLSTGGRLTLKDRLVHKQLRELFGTPHDLFSCCLLSTGASDNLATYTFAHSFVRHGGGLTERLTVRVPNLSDGRDAYRTPEAPSETFAGVVREARLSPKGAQGAAAVTRIQAALQKRIGDVAAELAEAEHALFELEARARRQLRRPAAQESSSCDSDAGGDSANAPKSRTAGRAKKKSIDQA